VKNPKFVDIDGIKTRYFEDGKGEPLVLFHGGNFGDSDNVDLANNWDRNWPWFANSFHVYAPDKLGQGFTELPKNDDEYTMASVVLHAYHFIQKMGLKKVHLVGHSRGGYLVTRLMLEHPELVSTVTEAFSYSGEHITDEWVDIRHQVGMLPKTVEAVEKMSKLFSAVLLPHLAQQKEETLRWIKEGRLKTPTLLVWGQNDPSAVVSGGLALFELVSASTERAQMHIFNQAGHYCYREHPEDFARVVTSFIQGGSRS
jgi:pimeloyl-ACP methyl ester carboxylesterase